MAIAYHKPDFTEKPVFLSSLLINFQIGPPTSLIDRELLLEDPKGPFIKSYYEYLVDISELLGANSTTAKVLMRAVLNFEIELAKVQRPY